MKKNIFIALSFAVFAAVVAFIAVSCNKNEGDLTQQLKLKAATTSTIVVRALGTSGAEHIKLTVAGTQVGSWTVGTAFANFTATTTLTGDIQLFFDNDATGRDVRVDYIIVNGVTRQAEAQAINTAFYANGRCGGGSNSELMHCNGYIDFGNLTAATTLSVSPSTLTVAAAASSTGTFNITSTTSWTVSSSQTWLTISPASGSNNGTVTVTAQQNTGASVRTAVVTVAATGATSQTVTVTQSSAGGASCTIPAMPSYASLSTNAFLPDPFTMMNGSRIATKADWTCRRAEIAAQAQEYEYGYYQNTPYTATTGAKSGNSIVVTINDNGKTISFTCSISYPTTGSAPYPAVIGVGGTSLNTSAIQALGVAIITFPNDQVAQQVDASSRGKGLFFDMYGSGHSASATMAWAWGVGRLIDALEKTSAANIDPTRLGVTGCSRNGKGALACGAFNERIKLTIPQESGSGGSASWRVSDYELSQGQSTQTLSEITGENVWFRANFNQFNSTATKLPFDHHMIQALCAPRALLMIENNILWLGPESSWNCANAAHMVWEALGIPDMMGFSETAAHNHCSFPSSQQPEVTAYIQKFLVGNGTASTTIMKCDPGFTFNKAKWVNWTVPSLQ